MTPTPSELVERLDGIKALVVAAFKDSRLAKSNLNMAAHRIEELREALTAQLAPVPDAGREVERYAIFTDGWGDDLVGLRHHPNGEWIKFSVRPDASSSRDPRPPRHKGRGRGEVTRLVELCFAIAGMAVLIWFAWYVFYVDVRGSRAECEERYDRPCGIVWEPVE